MAASKQDVRLSLKKRVSFFLQPSNLDDLFEHFVANYSEEKQVLLRVKKQIILSYILDNLGLKKQSIYSVNELTRITRELHYSVYAVGNRLVSLAADTEVLEEPNTLAGNARNLAKHLILGTPLGEDGADILNSHLACPRNQAAVFDKHDAEFLTALRLEFQYFLNSLSKPAIDAGSIIDADDEKQLTVFIHNFLGLYPLLEPAHGEKILIPKKSSLGQWTMVEYQFERIDISPQSDLVALLLTKKTDRMYAYGLVPQRHHEAEPYLLFSGTTFIVGQAANLSYLSNITPGCSTGESHDMTLVTQWLSNQSKKAITAGASQGAVLAMLTAARYPDKIEAAYCFNPTALSKQTLARVLPRWCAIPGQDRPTIGIYTQHNDPVFEMEKGFLPGEKTHIYKVLRDKETSSMNASLTSLFPSIIPTALIAKLTPLITSAYEAHVHLYSGRRQVIMVELNIERENARFIRELTSYTKQVLSNLFFPITKTNFLFTLFAEKYQLSSLQKNICYSTVLLLSAAVLKQALKHPNTAKGVLLCMSLYALLVPPVQQEASYRWALSQNPD